MNAGQKMWFRIKLGGINPGISCLFHQCGLTFGEENSEVIEKRTAYKFHTGPTEPEEFLTIKLLYTGGSYKQKDHPIVIYSKSNQLKGGFFTSGLHTKNHNELVIPMQLSIPTCTKTLKLTARIQYHRKGKTSYMVDDLTIRNSPDGCISTPAVINILP